MNVNFMPLGSNVASFNPPLPNYLVILVLLLGLFTFQALLFSVTLLICSKHACNLFSLKIIKEWNAELQERTGKFRKQATAIAEWDKRILQNRDVLLRLEVNVFIISWQKKSYFSMR